MKRDLGIDMAFEPLNACEGNLEDRAGRAWYFIDPRSSTVYGKIGSHTQ